MIEPLNTDPTNAAMTGPRRTIHITCPAEFDFERVSLRDHHIGAPAGYNDPLILRDLTVILFDFKLSILKSTDRVMGTMIPGSEVKSERK